MKEACVGSYEIALVYSGLTVDQLGDLLKLHSEKCMDEYDFEPTVAMDYVTDCDGFSEPAGTWTVKFIFDQCGGISKESWNKWYGQRILEDFVKAEELQEFIRNETGLQPKEL